MSLRNETGKKTGPILNGRGEHFAEQEKVRIDHDMHAAFDMKSWFHVGSCLAGHRLEAVMKSQVLLIVGFAFSVAGCVDGGQPAPGHGDEMQSSSPTTAFIEHMHAHADQLDDLNFALDDDDLYGAMTPAYWLSRHEEVSDVPAEWRPYLTGMRKAARDVENAPNLAVARAAAKRINQQCQGCHVVAGVR